MTTGEPPLFDDDDDVPVVQAPPVPAVRTGWWHRAGLVGAIAGFASAGLTVAGSMLALAFVELSFGPGDIGEDEATRMSMTVTSWGAHSEPEGRLSLGRIFGEVPDNGAPLVFAAVAVFAGAAVALFAARHPVGIGYRRVAVLTAAVAAAFLVATVWSIVMQEAAWLAEFERLGEIVGPESGFIAEHGIGFWLLIIGAVAAVGSAVCAALPVPAPPEGGRGEPDTPRYGFAVVTRLPDAEPEPRPDE